MTVPGTGFPARADRTMRRYPGGVGRKGIVLLALVAAIVALLGVALAARGDGGAKTPAATSPNAAKQYGDDADLMRRLARKKLTTRAGK